MKEKSDASLILSGDSLQGKLEMDKMRKLFDTLGEDDLALLLKNNERAAAGWIKSSKREQSERDLKQEQKISGLKEKLDLEKKERGELEKRVGVLERALVYAKGGVFVVGLLWALLSFVAPYLIPAGIKAGEAKWKEKVCAQVVECRKAKGEKGKVGK